MSWTNCDLKLSFGIVKTCSSCILMPYYPTSIDTGVVQQQYQLMNESISINSMFILSLLCLTTNTNFHSFYFLFINFSLVTSVPNSRDSCSCTIAQVVYEGDPARHHGSHFVIVTSGDKDISPRQLVLWHLGTVFLFGEMGETEKKHSLSMS